MANCAECVHAEVCREYVEGLADLLQARGVRLCGKELESILECDDCESFKDRSRFVELPIKPGEKVFYFDTAGRIYESTVTQLVYGATGFLIDAEQALFLIDSDVMFNSNLIGERFFLTREEAEQTQKERGGND